MTVWNAADKSANLAITGGLQVTHPTGAYTFGAVRADGFKTTGKHYFEAVYTVSGNVGVGVANATAALGNIGTDTNGSVYFNSGYVSYNGNIASYTAMGAGDILGVAFDADAALLWYSRNGVWNGNPAAGTGGLSVPGIGTFYPVTSSQYPEDDITANFGDTAFAYSAPAGFSAFGGAPAPPTIISRSFRALLDGQRLSHPLAANEPVTWSVVSGDVEIVGGIVRWIGNIVEPVGSYSPTIRATNGGGGEADQAISISVIANIARDAGNDNEGTPTFFDRGTAADIVWADFFVSDDSVHILAASGLVSGTPTLGTPALSGVQSLTASAFAAGTPSLGGPAVTQKHSLTASNLDAGTPSLGTPALTIVQVLAATGISTGAPVIGAPAQTQVHLLSSTAMSTGAPTLGAPSLAQLHSLAATALATGTPVLGSPAITAAHTLTATAIAAGTPTVGTPSISGKNVFTATALDNPAPVLGEPLLSIAGVMTPLNLVTGTPDLGSPLATQRHIFGAAGVASGTPALGAPEIGQVNALVALGLATGTPVIGSPGIGQQHQFNAVDLDVGTPTFGDATLVLAYALVANDIEAGTPILGAPGLNYVAPPPSTRRTIRDIRAPRTIVTAARPRTVKRIVSGR